MSNPGIKTSFPALLRWNLITSPLIYFVLGIYISIQFDSFLFFLISVGFGSYFSYAAWRRTKELPASLGTFSLSLDNAYLADSFDKLLTLHAIISPICFLVAMIVWQ